MIWNENVELEPLLKASIACSRLKKSIEHLTAVTGTARVALGSALWRRSEPHAFRSHYHHRYVELLHKVPIIVVVSRVLMKHFAHIMPPNSPRLLDSAKSAA